MRPLRTLHTVHFGVLIWNYTAEQPGLGGSTNLRGLWGLGFRVGSSCVGFGVGGSRSLGVRTNYAYIFWVEAKELKLNYLPY